MASVECTKSHLSYIDEHLIAEVVTYLEGESVEHYEVEHSGGLDGFMSALYNITLVTTTENGHKERQLIAKFMRGDADFRENSKSYTQFNNEIFVYAAVLPLYKELLEEADFTNYVKATDWVAPCYIAKFGHIKGLSTPSTEPDAVLVLGNLKTDGFQLGSRVYLGRKHLFLMARSIGQYHAMTYVLRLRADPRLEELRAGIVTLRFCNDQDPDDDQNNFYKVLYRAAFDRFFLYFDSVVNDGSTLDVTSPEDAQLIANIQRLREKYFAQPTHLLERLHTSIALTEEDRYFAAILHGDYNRNNVLFRYKNYRTKSDESDGNADADDESVGEGEGDGEAGDEAEFVKMIDFQELRYGSPAIDLSFFMYINTDRNIRESKWHDILHWYHASMFDVLSSVLKAGIRDELLLQEIDEQLEHYNYDKFYTHFSKFAFYGVMISMHFLPWLLCTPDECQRLSELFETDMHGKEFYQLSVDAGGDAVNREILKILRHSSYMGYMDFI